MPPMLKPSAKKAAVKKTVMVISPEAMKLYKVADRIGVDPKAFNGSSQWLLKLGGYKIPPSSKAISEATQYERQETARLRARVIALGGDWR